MQRHKVRHDHCFCISRKVGLAEIPQYRVCCICTIEVWDRHDPNKENERWENFTEEQKRAFRKRIAI